MCEEKKSTLVPLVISTVRVGLVWRVLRVAVALVVWAETPLAMAIEATASSAVTPTQAAEFEIIPEDPLAARLKFSDKMIQYEKTVYLKNKILSGQWWIDENRYVAAQQDSYSDRYQNGEDQPKIVIVDVRTGKVEDTGLEGKIMCYREGRIATNNNRLSRKPDGKVVSEEVSYFGELGKPLKAYRPSFLQAGLEINYPSCQLVPRWRRPSYPDMMFPLKIEHGAIYQLRPKDYPELRLGEDANNYNRLIFIRTGGSTVPPLIAYWEQPSGKRVEIPLNPGEKISHVSYVSFENAYFISVDLTNSQPIKTWEPRFVRLLYLDGTIKRFGVPKVILDLVKENKITALSSYSRLGPRWDVYVLSGQPKLEKLQATYVTDGFELLRLKEGGESPDGCKLVDTNRLWLPDSFDYYYIDICKGR